MAGAWQLARFDASANNIEFHLYLVRPDGHIGLAGTEFQEADLRQWLATASLPLEDGTLAEVNKAG